MTSYTNNSLVSLDGVADISNGFTLEERFCEEHFLSSVRQNQPGRFVVKLPIREELIGKLGDSREIALKRLHGLERRFKRDSNLKTEYARFLNEYLSLKHMQLIESRANNDPLSFYLPHHSIYKSSEQPAKIRVVFDAFCKSTNDMSLNDVLMIGPVVQQDLLTILMRFRTFRYVLVADIIKMYRQILIDSSQTGLQKILWRDDPSISVKTYELKTLTHGTSSTSYLATRCLTYLAECHATSFPVGSIHVKRDFYIDDLLTGADTIQDAKLVRDEIIRLLQIAKFELSKGFEQPGTATVFKQSRRYSNYDRRQNRVTCLGNAMEPTRRYISFLLHRRRGF